MGYIISLLNTKGGTGKSTISTNLARALQLDGFNVMIADADPQGTARQWSTVTEAPDMLPVFGVAYATIERELRKVKDTFDYIVIDGAAKMSIEGMVPIIKLSDLIIIPVQPSSADIWATSTLVDGILARQQLTEGKPKAYYLVSRQIKGTLLAGEITEVLEEQGLPVLEGRTTQRVIYADAIGDGVSVLDIEPDGKGSKEITTIKNEVLRVIQNG